MQAILLLLGTCVCTYMRVHIGVCVYNMQEHT